MRVKEFRICMPLSVEEYRIGQLYMIARHCKEQTREGEGVEVVRNEPVIHDKHGQGQFTEKRVYLFSKLPNWLQPFVPRICYFTEEAWNYYPYTKTDYRCSLFPWFSIGIETRYQDNGGSTENSLDLPEEILKVRKVDLIDIVNDKIEEKHYRQDEDLTIFQSKKTNRGKFKQHWQENCDPMMCSYKVVVVKLDLWGTSRIEDWILAEIRNILLLGHRQAVAWMDEWIEMSIEDVRQFESTSQKETNKKLSQINPVLLYDCQ